MSVVKVRCGVCGQLLGEVHRTNRGAWTYARVRVRVDPAAPRLELANLPTTTDPPRRLRSDTATPGIHATFVCPDHGTRVAPDLADALAAAERTGRSVNVKA